ncbi:SDR family NAD(P)-dependent oxidoreductase [Candidatus Poriferisocius sp.]|uniref:SDR family NAD(P)-dependent oxidoreductase n=1 Tax=Candidatus Poriferisocius sp. TaxID=3101276 RepID=UPI003B0176A7
MKPDALDAFRLDGKVAVITGAASGIGEATAELFAAAGARVVCGDLDGEGAETTVKRIREDGGEAVAQACNITSRDEVEALINRAVTAYGGLDIIANIAGAMFPGLIEDLTDQDIDAGINLNIKGVLYGCQAAIRAMKNNGGGVILNVSSGAIDLAYEGIGVYAFSKAAVAMLGRTLSLEVGRYGIRVCTLAPGSTLTNFTTWRLHNDDGTLNQQAYDEFLDYARGLSPIGAIGEAIDQAYLMLYLASDAGKFTTGNIFRSNGGQTTTF